MYTVEAATVLGSVIALGQSIKLVYEIKAERINRCLKARRTRSLEREEFFPLQNIPIFVFFE